MQQESSEKAEEIDRILDIVEEVLSDIEHLDELLQNEDPKEEMTGVILQIRELDRELLELQEIAPLVEMVIDEEEVLDETQLMEKISDKVNEERILTSNYLAVENTVSDMVAGKLTPGEYLEAILMMEHLITSTQAQLDNYTASIKEWTTETTLEKDLILEGFSHWKKALGILKSPPCVEEKDENVINQAMESAYSANEKLVMAQELTAYMKKTMEKKAAKNKK